MSLTLTEQQQNTPSSTIELDTLTSNGLSVPSPALQDELAARPTDPAKGTTTIIITCVAGVTFISSMVNGVVTVALPTLVPDLNIPPALSLWPASIYALTCGCSLILCGAVSDVVGSRAMYLVGCVLQSAFTLACGLSRNGFELIFFRASAGIAISFCLPSAVSLITTYFPHGRRRNIAFASMGGGQPLGFSLGLTAGGALIDGPGWRVAFYLAAALNTAILIMATLALPRTGQSSTNTLYRLRHDIDWLGGSILTISLALLSYVLAALTGSISTIHSPPTVACLSTALALIPVFIFWVHRQETLGRPAIVPTSLWRDKSFTAICIAVFLIWGAFNSVENLLTFYFQHVQHLSAGQSSVRFLPAPVTGVLANIVIGIIVHRVKVNCAVIIATTITAIAPLLVALVKPSSSYWEYVFPAMAFNPIAPDVLFTISNLIITAAFKDKTQALAGGVFNTVAQIGKSVGLALSAVIAASVTLRADHGGQSSPQTLLQGYHAAFWFLFAVTISTIGVSAWGLRGVGKIGLKRE